MFLLDTNVVSALRRPDRAPAIAAWIRGVPEDQLYLSVVVIGEIARGIRQQEKKNPRFATDLQSWLTQTLTLYGDRILQFDAPAAQIWGQLSADLGHPGADLMIAATALANEATVVTLNGPDFAPTGVLILDPTK